MTGIYTFTGSFEALAEEGSGSIYSDTSPIKPFGNEDALIEWGLDGHWTPGIIDNYRAFFNFKIPEAKINILWPDD